VTSIGRLQCAPLFDQRRPVLRPDRTAKRTGCKAGCTAAALWRGLALTAASTTAVVRQLRRAFTGTAG
jgi:hypothetical protein